MTIWRMRIACWISRLQTPTVAICNNYTFSTANMVPRTRLNITLYVHFLSFFTYPAWEKMSANACCRRIVILKKFCNIFWFSYWGKLFLKSSTQRFLRHCYGHSDIHHHTVFLTTGPQTLPQRVLFQIIVSLRSCTSCLHLLSRPSVSCIFSSITSFISSSNARCDQSSQPSFVTVRNRVFRCLYYGNSSFKVCAGGGNSKFRCNLTHQQCARNHIPENKDSHISIICSFCKNTPPQDLIWYS